MSDPERNKALVVEFWHAPFDDKERYFTDDVVWHLPPSVRVQGIAMDVQRGADGTTVRGGRTAVTAPGVTGHAVSGVVKLRSRQMPRGES